MRLSEHLPKSRGDDPSFAEHFARVQAGDSDALAELVQRFHGPVRRAIHTRLRFELALQRPWLRRRLSTDDILQDVFRSLLANLASFDSASEDAFCGLLARLVRNRISDAIRFHQAECRDARASAEGLDLEMVADRRAEMHPLACATASEERALVRSALAGLDKRAARLILARVEGAESFRVLAIELGYPSQTTARRAFAEARTQLARRLQGLRLSDKNAPR